MQFHPLSNRISAAVLLPALPPAKVKPKQQSLPGFKRQVPVLTSVMAKPERRLANTDILDFRNGADTKTIVRDLAASSPDLSATRNAYLRVGIPNTYTVVARLADGQIDPDGTSLAQQILRRVTYLGDPTLGYNSYGSLAELSMSLGGQLLDYGSMGLELVLDKARQPTRLSPIHTPSISYYEDKELGYVRPVQVVGGQEIDLDLPTVFLYNLDQSLLTPYSSSPFETAVQAVLADTDFLNSLRRVMRRAIHPRFVAEIIEEKVLASLPPEIQNDSGKMQEYLSNLVADITSKVNGLNPEDALVSFDTVQFSLMDNKGNGNIGDTLKAVQEMLNSKLAAGAKTLPSVLGRGNGSGTASSVETMLFLKNANMIRVGLNTLYSRALTQAVRLFGKDVYVDFEYAELDMRPSGELEAYKAMEQSRILDLMSIGFLPDEVACLKLTGSLPPAGYVNKSGTMFRGASAPSAANPNSQTSTMKDGQKTPESPKSPAKT